MRSPSTPNEPISQPYFPACACHYFGRLNAWLGRVSEVVIEAVKLDPAKPQYTMTQIHGKRYDISGSLIKT